MGGDGVGRGDDRLGNVGGGWHEGESRAEYLFRGYRRIPEKCEVRMVWGASLG
jgi:hypothetical protein